MSSEQKPWIILSFVLIAVCYLAIGAFLYYKKNSKSGKSGSTMQYKQNPPAPQKPVTLRPEVAAKAEAKRAALSVPAPKQDDNYIEAEDVTLTQLSGLSEWHKPVLPNKMRSVEILSKVERMIQSDGYNKNDPEAVEIRRKLATKGLSLGNAVTMSYVREFERLNDIKLPEDYVWFVTNVGNGGIDSGVPVNPEICGVRFSSDVARLYPLEKTYLFDYRPEAGKLIKNYSLNLCGDSYTQYELILKGEHSGEMCQTDIEFRTVDNDGWTVHSFKDFYLTWLDNICNGYGDLHFVTRMKGTIEEHIEQYKAKPDMEYLRAIGVKANKESVSEPTKSELHSLFLSETVPENKRYLARILAGCGFGEILSVIKDVFAPEFYENIYLMLSVGDFYFKKEKDSYILAPDAAGYYDMTLTLFRDYEQDPSNKSDGNYVLHLYDRFKLVMMNPRFNQQDVMDILLSDDERHIRMLSWAHLDKPLIKFIEPFYSLAREKEAQLYEKARAAREKAQQERQR